MKVIETKGLCKTFSQNGKQQHVINNLDLEINSGDFAVIMGSSGSGKTTLLYALSGMDKATLGEIRFSGEEITKLSNDSLAKFRRTHSGFVFQDVFLNTNMSILDNILVSGYLANKNKKQLLATAKELLEKVGIDESYYKRFPSQLSGGELQRVGIVRAIINNPEVVFADEPTGALNSKNSSSVLDILNKFNEEGKTIVMVTHDIKSAVRGNRLLYLKDGVIMNEIELGTYKKEDEEIRIAKVNAFLQEMGW